MKLTAFLKEKIFRLLRGNSEGGVVNQEITIKSGRRNLVWLSVGATVLVLLVIGSYGYLNCRGINQNQSLGTYDDPEVAFRETQKALLILSTHLNVGIESVQYIQEYDKSKNLIFKQQ